MSALKSLIDSGTKLWLDSIDPDLVKANRALGATGATSNPIIVSDIIKSGVCDERIKELAGEAMDSETMAWVLTDELVKNAQAVFAPVWEETAGNDGYVSFELDPLLEDDEVMKERGMSLEDRVAKYVELGKKWAEGHTNRMIKVPATEAGIACLEELAAHGITLNVTLIFSIRQYEAARDAVWRGAQRRANGLDGFKSVYSIFVSRVDVYTEKSEPGLLEDAQGMIGIANAKHIYQLNKAFWADKGLKLEQEMIFASTGTKKPEDPADKYVEAFAGSDIQTNPPKTNDLVEGLGKIYSSNVETLPADEIMAAYKGLDQEKLENTLVSEGVAKFSAPHKALIETIDQKRAAIV